MEQYIEDQMMNSIFPTSNISTEDKRNLFNILFRDWDTDKRYQTSTSVVNGDSSLLKSPCGLYNPESFSNGYLHCDEIDKTSVDETCVKYCSLIKVAKGKIAKLVLPQDLEMQLKAEGFTWNYLSSCQLPNKDILDQCWKRVITDRGMCYYLHHKTEGRTLSAHLVQVYKKKRHLH
jgi:hypothetical protein